MTASYFLADKLGDSFRSWSHGVLEAFGNLWQEQLGGYVACMSWATRGELVFDKLSRFQGARI